VASNVRSYKKFKPNFDIIVFNKNNVIILFSDPQPPFQNISTGNEETVNRIRNLSALLNNIKAFYENVLGQTLVLKLPDVIKIASNSNDDCSSCEEMRVLLLLLLGCAVQCERKEHFIDGIKQLDISVQHAIVECIQQITDNPESVWLNSEWSVLPEDEHEKERLYTTLVQHINKLVKERDELYHRIIDLAFQLDNICPNASSQINSTSSLSLEESSNSLFISSPNIMNSVGEQKSHLLVELADVKSKLRRVQQELEEKNEIVSELKEFLEQNKESCNKLRQDNLELIQEARSAKAYRDEIDVLNERVRKVDRLENEVQRYRDKMNELDFYKSRVEELREDNRILSETKVMLEEQLDGSRKRADQLPELEAQILKLSAYTNELVIQRDLDRNQIEGLIEELTHLRLDKKSTAEELTKVQTELTNLKCQMKIELLHQNGEGNLFEQINNDASKRVLKLELENQRLQSLMENIKNNRTSETTSSLFNNNHQNYSNSSEDIPNGNYTDDMLSPGDMSITSDSASISLTADINARIEKIENENECLRNTVERVKMAESKIAELEKVRNDLQNELKDLKSKRNGDSIKYEQIERNASQLLTENQRLQRLMDSKGKRYEEAQHEIQALESENQKLLATAETLKSSVKRLNDLEREVTNLEAENHRIEQEKKSSEKEIVRLKMAIDSKDSTIDDYATKLSTIELENKRIKKDIENNCQTNIKLKELEKENKEISNELFVSKKTVTTLRQDLVNEKIKSQQLSCELERVSNALEKIWQQKSHSDNTVSLNTDSLNKDWAKLLEDVFDDIVKKSLEQKEIKISALESSLKETMNKNVELNNTIQSLKRRIETTVDETQPTINHNLVSELQRKVTLFEDENKNLKNENITQKDTINDMVAKYKTLESTFESVNSKNTELQSDRAKLQVENSLIKSQNSSLLSQTANLETQIVSIQETRDQLQQKCEQFDNNYKTLLNDHQTLQSLHQQLTGKRTVINFRITKISNFFKDTPIIGNKSFINENILH
jgi:chromosome segregation ATPase